MKLRIANHHPIAAAIIAGMTLITMVSCAKAESEDTTKLEQISFDAWIEKYVIGQGIPAVRQSNGTYVEFLKDGDQNVQSSSDTLMWMKVNYTSTDIEGNIFATRDSLEALRQRTYTPHTYYVPEYIYVGDENYGMSAGRYFALRNKLTKPDGSTAKISLGSRVRLYIPSYLAYSSGGFTNDQGYGGQYPLGSNKIVIEDLTVKEVVKNPIDRETELVTAHAKQRWSLGDADTIAAALFVDTINFRPRADLLADFPEKPFKKEYGITSDSTVNIWYVGRFLPTEEYPDGFIFDTNIETIHHEFYNRRLSEDYTPQAGSFKALSFQPDGEESKNYIAAFSKAIGKLRQGQWSRIVFTSAYGYGSTGLSAQINNLQAQYNAYMDYYLQNSMQNSMYGYNYYENYFMNSYYYGNSNYYNYSTSQYSEDETEQKIVTEIQPYTPLIFEIYIETGEEEKD